MPGRPKGSVRDWMLAALGVALGLGMVLGGSELWPQIPRFVLGFGPAVATSQAPLGTPFVGPRPTEDCATWLYVPGDLLLGALRDLDAAPGTRLSRQQLGEVARICREVQEPGAALVDAELRLQGAVQATLTPRQLEVLEADQEAIVDSQPDMDSLVGRLREVSAGSAVVRPERAPDRPSAWSGTYLLAGLAWLASSEVAPLEPGQAAGLLPAVERYAARVKDLAEFYPRFAAVLTPAQRQALVAALDAMHARRFPPPSARVSLATMTSYLDGRLADRGRPGS